MQKKELQEKEKEPEKMRKWLCNQGCWYTKNPQKIDNFIYLILNHKEILPSPGLWPSAYIAHFNILELKAIETDV